MLVPQNRLGHFATARWASAFFRSILMRRKAWRVDPQLYEVSDANVLFQNSVRDLKSLAVFSVKRYPIHQLVIVGEMLFLELLSQGHRHFAWQLVMLIIPLFLTSRL
jgi:hypothetical protein